MPRTAYTDHSVRCRSGLVCSACLQTPLRHRLSHHSGSIAESCCICLLAAAVPRLLLRRLTLAVAKSFLTVPGLTCPPWPPRIQTKEQARRPPPCTCICIPFSLPLLATSLLLLFTSSNTEQPSTLHRLFAQPLRTPRLRLRSLTLLLPWSPACRALRYLPNARRSLPGLHLHAAQAPDNNTRFPPEPALPWTLIAPTGHDP